jgi:hypothetical protein
MVYRQHIVHARMSKFFLTLQQQHKNLRKKNSRLTMKLSYYCHTSIGLIGLKEL